MNGMFIVFTTIVLVLYIFVIFIVITPWFGLSILPYLVIFTFIGAAIILGVIWAFNQDMFTDMGWETAVIILFIFAAIIVAIFMIWYFIRKYTKKYAEEKVYDPCYLKEKYNEWKNNGYYFGGLEGWDDEEGCNECEEQKEHHHHSAEHIEHHMEKEMRDYVRDPVTGIPTSKEGRQSPRRFVGSPISSRAPGCPRDDPCGDPCNPCERREEHPITEVIREEIEITPEHTYERTLHSLTRE